MHKTIKRIAAASLLAAAALLAAVPAEAGTLENFFIYGKLVKVREKFIVVEPPRGVSNVLPDDPSMKDFVEKLKRKDPLRHKAFIEEQAKIRDDGGYRIPCDPVLLVKAGVDLKRIPIGNWIFVFLDRSLGSPAPAKNVYVFKSLDQMLDSSMGMKYDLKKLYEKNLFLVQSEMTISPGEAGAAAAPPKDPTKKEGK